MIKVEKINTLTGHKDCVYALAKHSKKNIFFSGAGEGFVVKWDLEKPELGELIAQVQNSIYALAFWERENYLLVGQNNEGLHLIDVENKQEIKSLHLGNFSIFNIQIIDKLAIVACSAGMVFFIDLVNWQILKNLQLSSQNVRSIAHNTLKQEIALGLSDHSIQILDLENLTLVKKIENAHENSVFSLVYTPTSDFLISSSRDAHLKIWETENHELIKDIPAHLYAINSISFSPSGKYFATASMDKSIKIWETRTFKLLKVIDKGRYAGHGTSVNKLLWTDYLGQLISASDDRSISIWDIKFAKEVV